MVLLRWLVDPLVVMWREFVEFITADPENPFLAMLVILIGAVMLLVGWTTSAVLWTAVLQDNPTHVSAAAATANLLTATAWFLAAATPFHL